MNESMRTLLERRSVRKFKPEHISKEEMDYILQAAVCAPTSMDLQDTVMAVVSDEETKAFLSALNAKVMGGAGDPFYGAPDIVIVFGDGNRPNWKQDGAIAAVNMLNMAKAQGIGSCYINRAMEMFDRAEGRELARRWGVPESYRGVSVCIFGYPDGPEPKMKERRPGRIIFTDKK